MCGLAGIVSQGGVDPAALESMAEAIAHRGPDGRGYLLCRAGGSPRFGRTPEQAARGLEGPQVGFAHLRLAIIDLREINDQPLFDSTGELALSYNGEIYNYVELRQELEGLGHQFRTSGDTEVLLAAYSEWGPACVERLVGMWAFSILDARRDVVFLSRDRFGVKPLYWTLRDGALLFASEIKALLAAAPGPAPEPNEEIVRRYLLTGGVDESEQTFFDGVFSLPAAHNALIPLGRSAEPLKPERYWSLPEEGYDGGVGEAAAEFRAMLADSVRVHARSDVPVGTCLSGGLDSSAIVCVAEELRRDQQIPHYAHSGFGYLPEQAELSERPYMEEVVQRTGLGMTYVEVPPERFGSALVEIARQQDEPFGSTSIAAQWFVFESAHRAGLKVMLDGQGADEVLGGYHYFFPLIASALLRARRPLAYSRFARSYRRAFGAPPLSWRYALASLAPGRLRRAAPERLAQPPAAALLAPGFRDGGDGAAAPAEYDSINEILAAHTTSHGLPSLLRFEDRNSMAHSIEARVPFLDHRLVEFAFRLPGEFKIHGVETKYVMREAMRGVLPERIRTRSDKIGFRAEPAATWALAERNREALLANRTAYEERWFDRRALADLFAGSDRSAAAEFMLWRAVNAKLWLRSFWGDGDPLA